MKQLAHTFSTIKTQVPRWKNWQPFLEKPADNAWERAAEEEETGAERTQGGLAVREGGQRCFMTLSHQQSRP